MNRPVRVDRPPLQRPRCHRHRPPALLCRLWCGGVRLLCLRPRAELLLPAQLRDSATGCCPRCPDSVCPRRSRASASRTEKATPASPRRRPPPRRARPSVGPDPCGFSGKTLRRLNKSHGYRFTSCYCRRHSPADNDNYRPAERGGRRTTRSRERRSTPRIPIVHLLWPRGGPCTVQVPDAPWLRTPNAARVTTRA
jgi:hypothetical protein